MNPREGSEAGGSELAGLPDGQESDLVMAVTGGDGSHSAHPCETSKK